ncbi:MAG TPA: hypothetical protein VJL90_09495 [Pseudorhodoplanes sp.]|nr:hypothetical protein [Pseudorhodoplanes sp.]
MKLSCIAILAAAIAVIGVGPITLASAASERYPNAARPNSTNAGGACTVAKCVQVQMTTRGYSKEAASRWCPSNLHKGCN